jgi:hypothetical protein
VEELLPSSAEVELRFPGSNKKLKLNIKPLIEKGILKPEDIQYLFKKSSVALPVFVEHLDRIASSAESENLRRALAVDQFTDWLEQVCRNYQAAE